MPDLDSAAEDLARESSLVCRENRKLRQRVEELEAVEKRLKQLEQQQTARPSVASFEQAQLAAAEKRATDAEAAAAVADDARKTVAKELEHTIITHDKQLVEAHDKQLEAEAARDALSSELSALKSRLKASAASGAQQFESRLAALTAELEETRNEVEVWRLKLKAQDEDSAEAIRKLRAEVAAAREEGARSSDAAALKAAVGGLQAQLAELRKQKTVAEQGEAAARKQLAAAHADRDEAKAAASRSEDQRAIDRRKHKTEVEGVQAELREARKQMSEQVKELRERLAAYEGGDAKLASELKRLKREVSEQKARADESAEGWQKEKAATSELRERVEERDIEITRLRAEIIGMQQAQAQLTPHTPPKPDTSDLPSSFGQFVELKREVASLKEQLDATRQHAADPTAAWRRVDAANEAPPQAAVSSARNIRSVQAVAAARAGSQSQRATPRRL